MLVAIFAYFAITALASGGNASSPSMKPADVGLSLAMRTGSMSLQVADKQIEDPLAGETVVPDRLVVRFKADATAGQRAAARDAVDGTVDKRLALPRAELLEIPKGSSETAIAEKLSELPGVAYAEPDFVARTTVAPNDPEFSQLWAMNNLGQTGGTPDADIDAPEAWDISTGSPNSVVAVVDTGVDYLHPDLTQNIWNNPGETGLDAGNNDKRSNNVDDDGNGMVDDWHGWNWDTSQSSYVANDPMDDNFHGTHVAGTIAAVGDNNEGVAGVSWHSKIMPLKFLNASGSGSITAGADAMLYAAENGAQIVSGSFGYVSSNPSAYERDVIATHPETLFVFAAGNNNQDNDNPSTSHYPCSHSYENVICVAATDHNDQRASFSNYGPNKTHLSAPGVSIRSTKASVHTAVSGNYFSISGTSMATPHVSGAAALLLSAFPAATTDQVRTALIDGVDPKQQLANQTSSGGRLNVKGSLDELGAILNQNPNETRVEVGGTRDLRVTTADGANDNVSVTSTDAEIVVSIPGAAIVPGRHCYAIVPDAARCDKSRVKRIRVTTKDGDDQIENQTSIDSYVDPGSGANTISGGSGADTIASGDGADSMQGGSGSDTVSYASRTAAVRVEFNNVDDDGAVGEHDNVADDIEQVVGGNGNDVLIARAAGSTLDGRGGDDTLTGGAGNDTIIDGNGVDSISAGDGDDSLSFLTDDGDDVIDGGSGNDTVTLEDVSGYIYASLDNVANDGRSGNQDNVLDTVENVIGGSGYDQIVGSSASNVLSGGLGVDQINGGNGGADVLSGDESLLDTVTFSGRTDDLSISLDNVANDGAPGDGANVKVDFERVVGGSGDDELIGDDGSQDIPAVTLEGVHFEADDWLDGGPGADTLSGSAGRDLAYYGDRQTSNPVNVSIDGQANDGGASEGDNVGLDVESILGSHGNDVLTGSDGPDEISGSSGTDIINGGGGDDKLDGALDSDTIVGGDGVDTLTFGGTLATSGYGYSTPVTVDLTNGISVVQGTVSDNVASDVEAFTAGWGADTMIGNDESNILNGSDGDDTIVGAGGDDLLGGDGDDDNIDGGAGHDRIRGDHFTRNHLRFQGYESYGTVNYNVGPDVVDGGDGNDLIETSGGDDNVTGGLGDDTIDGGFDADQMAGGAGSDTVTYRYRGEYLTLSLNDVADDGRANENDFIASDVENLTGGFDNDTIVGNEFANRLDGFWGNDTITAADGNDDVVGGSGSDNINLGIGDDVADSLDEAVDTVNCGDGSDTLRADTIDSTNSCELTPDAVPTVQLDSPTPHRDATVSYRSKSGVADNIVSTYQSGSYTFTATGHAINAGNKCDQVSVTVVKCDVDTAADTQINVQLVDGNDAYTTSASVFADQEIYAGSGNDVLTGGSGVDMFDGGTGADQMFGGGGLDEANYRTRTAPVSVRLNGIADDGEIGEGDLIAADIESAAGGSGNDILIGSPNDDRLYGLSGDDLLDGGFGDDWIIGGFGRNTVTYADRSAPVQIATSFAHPSNFYFAEDRAAYRSGEAGETDWVGADVSRLIGGNGDDHISCQLSGGNTMELIGGPGGDTFGNCGNESNYSPDSVSYADRSQPVNVSFDGIANDGEAGEGDNFVGPGIERIEGGQAGDTLGGDAGANEIRGLDGNDQINVLDESVDKVECGAGEDVASSDALDEIGEDCESNTSSNVVSVNSSAQITYLSGGGIANDVVIASADDRVSVTDAAAVLTPGYGCQAVNTHEVSCFQPDGVSLDIQTRDRNDTVNNQTTLTMSVNGGTGDDTFSSGNSADVYTGGAGIDTVSYAERTSSVTANFDGLANDGSAGEQDKIATDVERVLGGSSDDNLTGASGDQGLVGNDGNDTLSGAAGNDTLDGGSGTDVLDGGSADDTLDGGHDTVSDQISGGDGIDVVSYADRTENLNVTLDGVGNDGESGEGDNVASDVENVEGGSGDDTFVGGASPNDFTGGLGDDYFSVQDGGTDAVHCGDGNDAALVDETDAVDADCESVTVPVNTTIVFGPADGATIDEASATYGFNSNVVNATFECKLDDAAFAPCTSPWTAEYLYGGSHTVSIRAVDTLGNPDPTPVVRTVTANIPGRTSISASTITASSSFDLTALGTLDWSHWGRDTEVTFNHKDQATSLISDYTMVGSGAVATRETVIAPTFSWSDGAPQVSESGTMTGISTGGAAGRGFRFTVPASQARGRVLTLFVGYEGTNTNLTATGIGTHSFGGGGSTSPLAFRTYEVYFRAASSSDVVTATWTQSSSEANGKIYLFGAALSESSDTTPPDTTITAGPAEGETIADNTPTISVASNESSINYACKVDSGSYQFCFSGYTLSALSDGQHTLRVRATDRSGNVDTTPAVRTFTVDTTPPQTTIDSAPQSFTNDTTPDFTFHGTPASDTANAECRTYPQGSPNSWGPCSGGVSAGSGTHTSDPLADGSYTFEVRAADAGGNTDQTPAATDFNVDTAAPSASIGAPSGIVNDSTPVFGITYSDTSPIASTQCQIVPIAPAGPTVVTPCSDGGEYPSLADGLYSQSADPIVDAAGNVGSSTGPHFIVDTLTPTVTVSSPASGSATSDTTPPLQFAISDANEGPATGTTCEVSGATTIAQYTCTSGADLPALNNGTNTITVRHTDLAGNIGSSVVSFVVDNAPPSPSIAMSPTGPSNNTAPVATITDNDPTPSSGIATRVCQIDRGANGSIEQSISPCPSGTAISGVADGVNRIHVDVIDNAGNSGTANVLYTLDSSPPNTAIDSGPANGSTTDDQTVAFTFHGTPAADTDGFQCRIDGGTWTSCGTGAYGSYTTPELTNGVHTFEVRARDAFLNYDQSPASRSFTVQATAPAQLTKTGPATITSPLNLTAEGTADWAHWGRSVVSDFDHKASGGLQIPNYTQIGSAATPTRITSTPNYSWSDGIPTASATNNGGVSVGGASGRGFRITAPASQTTRTLKVYVGVLRTSGTTTASGRLTATLSDGSAASVTDTTVTNASNSAATDRVFTLTYRSAAPSATLTVEWTQNTTTSAHRVRLYSASLSSTTDVTPPPAPTISSPAEGATVTTPTTAVSFTGEAGASFQCKVDTGSFAACSSPYTTPTLSDGQHTVKVRAIDAAGNIGPATTRTFNVAVPQRSATVSVADAPASLNLTTVGSETTIDWAQWGYSSSSSGNYRNRKSGATDLIGVYTGSGTVSRQTTGAPAASPAISWTGGTPTATVSNTKYHVSRPSVNNYFELNVTGSTTNMRTLRLYVGLNQASGYLQLFWGSETTPFYTSPTVQNTTGASFKEYTVAFRASSDTEKLKARWVQSADHGTNRISLHAATLTQNADAAAPETTINSGPADNEVITTTTPTFGFSASEASQFQCRVDTSAFASCTSPFTTASLSNGQHSFEVRAIDTAGNIDPSPAKRTFVVEP